jgi:RNA polymerase-binding protein DksA
MKSTELSSHKLELLKLRKRLNREIDSSEEAMREDVVTPGEITTMPTHPADQAAEGVDAEIAISQNEELLLSQVETALVRIEAGTYGACEECGDSIGTERLQALPFASRCIRCAQSR